MTAVSANTVTNWIAEANRIYRQVAMTFTLVSVQNVYGKNRWFEIDDNTEFQEMCSYTNYTGGLELYCVGIITWANGIHSDRRLAYGDPRRGMAVKAEATLETLAHEIGHATGLSDMYKYDPGDGLVSEDKTRMLNWSGGTGTGHHAPNLMYRDLSYRVLMDRYRNTDIPLDGLTGVVGTNRLMISVGLNQMVTREPVH